MNRFALVAVLVAIFGTYHWLYGVSQHQQGYLERDAEITKETAQALEQARRNEQLALLELEEAYHDAHTQEQVAQATIASLTDERDRLRQLIAPKAHAAQLARTTSGVDAVASACWIALDESIQRYAEMAGIADRYVEDLRKGQAWAKVVKRVVSPVSP